MILNLNFLISEKIESFIVTKHGTTTILSTLESPNRSLNNSEDPGTKPTFTFLMLSINNLYSENL